MVPPLKKYRPLPIAIEDPVFRLARRWSNRELKKIGHLCRGDVVNVSAWQDQDKEGKRYREYFPNANSYTMTNFDADKSGLQGIENELYLDLARPVSKHLERSFDVVFNHTTLEHIFEFNTAFQNICEMSRDLVVLVVPWLQEHHSDYGDFWRFSPTAIARLFQKNNMSVARCVWNDRPNTSVYIFTVATRHPNKWRGEFEFDVDPASTALPENYAGRFALKQSLLKRGGRKLYTMVWRNAGDNLWPR